MSTQHELLRSFRKPHLGALLASLALILLAGCDPAVEQEEPTAGAPEATIPAAPATPEDAFAAAIETAHGLEAWRERPVFASGIDLDFGGQGAIVGEVRFPTDLSASRIDLENGTSVVYDGESVWVAPAESPVPQARFHALTWPYFLAAPMKIRDPGTHLELLGTRNFRGREVEVARLTFDSGVGDTPEDWYVLYRDPDTDLLRAMAYIVTYGKSAETAEQEPHMIVYERYAEVGGVQVPVEWTFWNWNEATGPQGEPLGHMRITDPRFVEPDLGAFDRAEGAREDVLPQEG